MASQPVCQIYAELSGYEPRIWRRFQIARNVSVARLGYVLMTLFEMKGEHLFAIETNDVENTRVYFRERHIKLAEEPSEDAQRVARTRYVVPDPDDPDDMDDYADMDAISTDLEGRTQTIDATTRLLKHVLDTPGQKLTFSYDYGDGWEIDVTLESVLPGDDIPGASLPKALAGEGFGIVEDCGGADGLKELREAFRAKRGVSEMDLDAFDIDDMNFRLKKLPRVFKQSYEDGLEPTQRSVDLLERAYLRADKRA